jgi:hypothetical protein
MPFRVFRTVGILAVLVVFTTAWTSPSGPGVSSSVCLVPTADPDPPVYYQIDLVTTKKVPGARLAKGTTDVTYAPSPFGVAISPTGTYVYNLDIAVNNLRAAQNGVYAVWVTTPDLKNIRYLGNLDDDNRLKGRVDWNKFLVVISLEPNLAELGDRWSGPIVLRGMSRSGFMHTMAGHGPFETEPCAVYGYS